MTGKSNVCKQEKTVSICESSTYIGIYTKENIVLVACFHSLCTREKRHLLEIKSFVCL